MKQKTIRILYFICTGIAAQLHATGQGITNFGNMHLFGAGTMSTQAGFTNSAGAGTDYTNDGYFYVKGDFINNKANMPAGTGTTEFNDAVLQNISGTNTPQFNHLLISNASGGIQPAIDFNVAGNWTNNGLFLHNNGSVNFNGGALQTLSGSVKTIFFNFSLANNTGPVSLVLQQTTDLLNRFSFIGVSNSTMNSNGYLNVKSSAARTAQVDDMTANNTLSGNSITGDAVVERYIQSGRKWRFLSIPDNSTQTVRASWMEGALNINQDPNPGYGTVVTDNNPGAVAAGFDAQSISGPSVKYYNASNSYTGIVSPSDIISAQRCYMNFVRGDRTAWPSNAVLNSTVLRTTGPLKQSVISYPLGSGVIDAVGNPYASRIDLRKLNLANMTNYIWLWDPLLAGSYGVGGFQTLQFDGVDYRVMPGTGSYGGPGSVVDSVESGQGFFMQGNTGGGSVQFTEPVKTSGSRVVNFAPGHPEKLRAMLSIVSDTVVTLLDGAQADFASGFSNNFSLEDGLKMDNTSEGVGIKVGNRIVVYDRHAPINDDDTIQLNLSMLRAAAYRWNILTENLDEPGLTGFLGDRLYNNLSPLNLAAGNNVYDFTATAGTPGSYAANRFYIIFKTATVLPVVFSALTGHRLADENIGLNWSTQNELNIGWYAVERSSDGQNFSALPVPHLLPLNNNGGGAAYTFTDLHSLPGDNYYRIHAVENSGASFYTNIVKIDPLKKPGSITVYPNPIADHMLALHFENKPGAYHLQLFNSLGQLMLDADKTVTGTNETVNIELQKRPAAGSYQLVITTGSGDKEVKKVIVE